MKLNDSICFNMDLFILTQKEVLDCISLSDVLKKIV